MHIFLTGDVQVGKSTIINKTLAALKIERPGGFRSVSVPDLPDGAMSVYLLAAAEKAPAMGDFNRVGACDVEKLMGGDGTGRVQR